jgi:hypothetical protein
MDPSQFRVIKFDEITRNGLLNMQEVEIEVDGDEKVIRIIGL